MGTIKRFEDIEAWKAADAVNAEIYMISSRKGFYKDYGLREQIRRASVSIMANIAEGFEREGKKEFIQFLSIAKGSAGETRSLLRVALREKYITKAEYNRIYEKLEVISCMIYGFIRYLKKKEIQGNKYK